MTGQPAHPPSGGELIGRVKNDEFGEECMVKKAELLSTPGRQGSNLGFR